MVTSGTRDYVNEFNIDMTGLVCTPSQLNEEIDWQISHVCDLVSYDDPDYENKVIELAISCATFMYDPNIYKRLNYDSNT